MKNLNIQQSLSTSIEEVRKKGNIYDKIALIIAVIGGILATFLLSLQVLIYNSIYLQSLPPYFAMLITEVFLAKSLKKRKATRKRHEENITSAAAIMTDNGPIVTPKNLEKALIIEDANKEHANEKPTNSRVQISEKYIVFLAGPSIGVCREQHIYVGFGEGINTELFSVEEAESFIEERGITLSDLTQKQKKLNGRNNH